MWSQQRLQSARAIALLVGAGILYSLFSTTAFGCPTPSPVITTISAGTPQLGGPSATVYPTDPSLGLRSYAKFQGATKTTTYNQPAANAWFIDSFTSITPPFFDDCEVYAGYSLAAASVSVVAEPSGSSPNVRYDEVGLQFTNLHGTPVLQKVITLSSASNSPMWGIATQDAGVLFIIPLPQTFIDAINTGDTALDMWIESNTKVNSAQLTLTWVPSGCDLCVFMGCPPGSVPGPGGTCVDNPN